MEIHCRWIWKRPVHAREIQPAERWALFKRDRTLSWQEKIRLNCPALKEYRGSNNYSATRLLLDGGHDKRRNWFEDHAHAIEPLTINRNVRTAEVKDTVPVPICVSRIHARTHLRTHVHAHIDAVLLAVTILLCLRHSELRIPVSPFRASLIKHLRDETGFALFVFLSLHAVLLNTYSYGAAVHLTLPTFGETQWCFKLGGFAALEREVPLSTWFPRILHSILFYSLDDSSNLLACLI